MTEPIPAHLLIAYIGVGVLILRNGSSKPHNPPRSATAPGGSFEWSDLRHFLAVARAGSTLAAGKALRVSQSTVLRRLDELETRIGWQLVSRGPTGYRLTELGAEMVSHAERVEEAVIAFERRLAAYGGAPEGIVRVTCPEAVGVRLMRSDLIKRFRAQYPGLRLEFVVSDRLLDLAGGEADIAIRGHDPGRNDLFGRKLGESRWAIYASRPYAESNGMPRDLGEIGDHPICLFDVELTEHVTNRWLRSVAPNAAIGARCNSLTALAQAVRSGAGLAALPTVVGDREPDLIRVLGPLPDLVTPFYILTHQDLKRTPRVRAFFDFILGSGREVRSILSGYDQSP